MAETESDLSLDGTIIKKYIERGNEFHTLAQILRSKTDNKGASDLAEIIESGLLESERLLKEAEVKTDRWLHYINESLSEFGFENVTLWIDAEAEDSPINAIDLLMLISKVDAKTLDEAKNMLASKRKQQAQKMLDIQHEHSRKEKAEAIDYYRQHPKLNQATCIDYLREHFPNGQKRPEQLSHSKVKGWLNGSRKK
ncbi:MAG TPA: hypothetical protein VMV35_00325 [Halothiobacillus sp.]|nr:hypothetical protein [Halothiobacillus sp.]